MKKMFLIVILCLLICGCGLNDKQKKVEYMNIQMGEDIYYNYSLDFKTNILEYGHIENETSHYSDNYNSSTYLNNKVLNKMNKYSAYEWKNDDKCSDKEDVVYYTVKYNGEEYKYTACFKDLNNVKSKYFNELIDIFKEYIEKEK